MSATVTIKDTTAEEAALATGAQLAPPSDGARAGTAPPPTTASADANADVVNPDKSVTTTDRRGRRITFKQLKSIDRFRAAGILGEQSMNLPCAAMASVAFSVKKIDDTPWGPLLSLREVEAVIGILDDDGIDAVNVAYDRHFNTAPPSQDDVRTLVGN